MAKRVILSLILVFSFVPMSLGSSSISDLVGYWRLDEAIGLTAADSSGNGNHGRLVGSVDWLPNEGKFGGSVYFDGINPESYVEIPVEGLSLSSGTLSLWAYLRGEQSGPRNFFGYGGDSRHRIQLFMNDKDTRLDLGLGGKRLSERNWVRRLS